jgi:hypothetical protein
MEHLSSLYFNANSVPGVGGCAEAFFDGWREVGAALGMGFLTGMGFKFPCKPVHLDKEWVLNSLRENEREELENQEPAEHDRKSNVIC